MSIHIRLVFATDVIYSEHRKEVYMDVKTAGDFIFTAAIAFFAYGTWKATRSYARIAGLSLFLQHLKAAKTPDHDDYQTAIKALKIIRAEFPDLYKEMRGRINQNTAKLIESES